MTVATQPKKSIVIKDVVCADPLYVATMGFVSCSPCTVARHGEIHVTKEEYFDGWYYRRDDDDAWYGPLTYQQANSQARTITKLEGLENAPVPAYAQVGRMIGTGPMDPPVGTPSCGETVPFIKVIYMYANGRQYLSGKIAVHNSKKVP